MSRFGKTLGSMLLILVTGFALVPFYVMLVMSTHYTEDIFKGLPLAPGKYLMENLQTVFRGDFVRTYFNSVIVSASAVILSVFTSSTIGYALGKFRFALRKSLTTVIAVTMMVPTQVGLIGYVIEMKHLGIGNTLLPVILAWAAFPFGAFFMTQFIKDGVPVEMLESARIDGCSEIGIFLRIVIPLIQAGIATLAILVFIWSWNNYLLPLVAIHNPKLYTIPLFVSNLGIVHRTDYASRMAALALATFPVLAVFLCGAGSFIKGATAGAIKG